MYNIIIYIYVCVYIWKQCYASLQARINDFPGNCRINRSWNETKSWLQIPRYLQKSVEIRVFHQTKEVRAQGYGATVWTSHISSKWQSLL
jgi:hypothetical protein